MHEAGCTVMRTGTIVLDEVFESRA